MPQYLVSLRSLPRAIQQLVTAYHQAVGSLTDGADQIVGYSNGRALELEVSIRHPGALTAAQLILLLQLAPEGTAVDIYPLAGSTLEVVMRIDGRTTATATAEKPRQVQVTEALSEHLASKWRPQTGS